MHLVKRYLYLLSCAMIGLWCTATMGHLIKDAASVDKVKLTCQCPLCNLENANLTNFQPGNSKASNNRFVGAGFPQDKCWLGCDFQSANLRGANLEHANFTICVRGYSSPLTSVNFTNARMVGANLSHGQFIATNFSYGELSHINFSHSNLFLAKFANSKLRHAIFKYAVSARDAMHGWGGIFLNADLSFADLSYANLYGNFQGTNFSHAKFLRTKIGSGEDTFSQTSTDPAHRQIYQKPSDLFAKTNFSNTDLRQIELTGDNKPADLTTAILCHTIMPDGKENNRDCREE